MGGGIQAALAAVCNDDELSQDEVRVCEKRIVSVNANAGCVRGDRAGRIERRACRRAGSVRWRLRVIWGGICPYMGYLFKI